MLSEQFKKDRPYLERKFKTQICNPATGLDNETLKSNLIRLTEELNGEPHELIKAKAFRYVCENLVIDVNPQDFFVCFGCWNRYDRPLSFLMSKWEDEVNKNCLKELKTLEEQNASGSSKMWKDFDHSVPDWEAVLSLGFPGLLERVKTYRRKCEADGKMGLDEKAYYEGLEITYAAILKMLDRFHLYALEHSDGNQRVKAVAACLDSLRKGAPSNIFEALQLIYLFFIFGEHIDRFQVRSLGNLDRMLYPYFQHDIAEGRYTEKEIRDFFAYFMMQWASIDNYWGHPFYFGGSKANGETEINDLSYLILDVYDQLDIPTPKLQIKIAANTPVKFIDKALDMIRRGHSSIVFLSENAIRRALLGQGCTEEEARTCVISGCYEFIPQGRGNGTCAGHINMLKPIELLFHNGRDPKTGISCGIKTGELSEFKTFDEFYKAYIQQLEHIIESVLKCANDFEKYLHRINPAQVYSGTIENSLKTAKDAFHNGSVYNISGILNAGFANAVDALMVIKDFVFEKHEVNLAEFRDILQANWQGHEKLRLKILNSKNKFGNGIESVDSFAEGLALFLANKINMRPNSRNGFFAASMHSARQFIELGEKTGASPDGRLAGEEISKNASPVMGMDKNGVTALIKSVTKIDSALFPGDFPLDVMMHPATVQGNEGLNAMRSLLKTYMDKHGIAIHFNIFDANVLLDAQKHPEKYEGLQVRVCGWNVRFNDIAKREQDEYIKRALSIKE